MQAPANRTNYMRVQGAMSPAPSCNSCIFPYHLGYPLRSFLSRHKPYEIIEQGDKQMLKTLLFPVIFFKEKEQIHILLYNFCRIR
jgi:hypothetical protein